MFGRGLQHLQQAVCRRNIAREVQLLVNKTFANSHTPRALFAHTISVSDALSLSSSTTNVNENTSESVSSSEAPEPEAPCDQKLLFITVTSWVHINMLDSHG